MAIKADIVIVGGGIAGTAMLYELAKARVGKVVLLEAGGLASAITGESGGYIRKFNTDPYVGKLSSISYDYYHNFENEVGGSCGFVKTGLVSRVSIASLSALSEQIAGLKAGGYNISVSMKPPTQALKAIAQDDAISAYVYEPDLGRIDTKLTCRSWAHHALEYGADVYEHAPAKSIVVKDGRVIGVQTEHELVEAKQVILSAGARSSLLLEPLPLSLKQISARSFQYNVYKDAAKYLDCAFMDNVAGFYLAGFANGDVFAGILNHNNLVIEAGFDHGADQEAADNLHEQLKARFVFANKAEVMQVKRSYDAFTDDQRALVRTFDELPGLVLATGLSAGGIKIAPALAKEVVGIASGSAGFQPAPISTTNASLVG